MANFQGAGKGDGEQVFADEDINHGRGLGSRIPSYKMYEVVHLYSEEEFQKTGPAQSEGKVSGINGSPKLHI